MSSKKGIFGGSFNPVHAGHLVMAQDAMDALSLDEVLFVPCSQPAHKQPGSLASSDHRVSMLELAIAGHAGFSVNVIELAREGTSYTIDTMRELKRLEPETEWFFIIGLDSLFELHTWKNIHELLELCSFITLARPGDEERPITEETIRLPAPWPEKLASMLQRVHLVDISSTDIRERCSEAKSIQDLVPGPVADYIKANRLYSQKLEENSSKI